jgi:hypothetical protein
MGLGVIVAFAKPDRKLLSRLASILGGLVFVGGTFLSPDWRDPQFWREPYVYGGLLLGVALPFLLVLAWDWASRKKRT